MNFVCVFEWFSGWLLDPQLNPVGPTPRVAQTGILVFKMDIFVNKWLPLVTLADKIKASNKSSRFWFQIKKFYNKYES